MSSLRMRRRGVLASFKPPASLDLNFANAGALDSRITFTRASSASYFDATGTLQTAGTNVARFDYDPVTHAPRGLLIEEARTNLLLNSATLGTQSVTVTAQAYTLSFYGTGTVTLSGTSTAGPLTGTGAFPARVSLTFTPTAGTLTLTVSGSVLNANLEAGSFATSYVTTAGASATRAGDVPTMPVASWFNAGAGTLAAEALFPYAPTAFPTIASLDDGSTANRILLYAGAPTTLAAQDTVGGVSQSNFNVGILSVGTAFKSAIRYAPGAQAGASGGVVVTASGVLVPPSATQLQIGHSAAGNFFSGYVRRVRYWPRALGTAELVAVTR